MNADDDEATAGVAIGNGVWVAWIFLVTCDLEAAANHFGLPHWTKKESNCWNCPAAATDGPFNYRHCARDAGHRRCLHNPRDAMAADHPLWKKIVGLCRASYLGDHMHTVYQGVLPHMNGSVLNGLLETMPETSKPRRMVELMKEIKAAYKALGIPTFEQVNRITVDMFDHGPSEFAELRGLRAYEQKSLLPVLLQVAREEKPERYTELKLFDLLECLDEIENVLSVAGFWLTELERRKLKELTERFQNLHEDVTFECLSNGELLFNYVTKTHYMWHLLVDNGGLNPHAVWCFCFEDFLRHVIRCSRACTAGTPVELVGARVVRQYAVALDHSVSVDRVVRR